jgi:predicted phosphodiesterase
LLYNKGKWSNIASFLRYEREDIHRRIASSIGRQLGVKYAVFGHTHEADLYSLSSDAGAEYANSGTWTKVFSSNFVERLLHEEQESVFVQILKDEDNKLELMKWKEELGRGERVNLFERVR